MCWTYFETIGHNLKIWAPFRNLFAPLVSQAGYGPAFNQDADRTIGTEPNTNTWFRIQLVLSWLYCVRCIDYL